MKIRLSNRFLVAMKGHMTGGQSFWDAHGVVKGSSSYSIIGYENGFSAMLDAIGGQRIEEVDRWVSTHSHAEVLGMIERALWIHAGKYTRPAEYRQWPSVVA